MRSTTDLARSSGQILDAGRDAAPSRPRKSAAMPQLWRRSNETTGRELAVNDVREATPEEVPEPVEALMSGVPRVEVTDTEAEAVLLWRDGWRGGNRRPIRRCMWFQSRPDLPLRHER
jgi:hypothetical protein